MRWIEASAALVVMLTGSAQAQTPAQSSTMPVVPPAAHTLVQAKFVVVLDAAHGGSDTGARLHNDTLEKNITLALSVRLRSTLHAHGIDVVTTREGDETLPVLNRAEAANHAQAAACVVLHATATGSGIHLYTSSLAPAVAPRLQPWLTAQASYVTQSLKLESEIDSALAHAQIPVTLGRASVQPMDNLTCPTVAVEMAPLVAGHVTDGHELSDGTYEGSVVNALAAALESWRNDWKQ